MDIEINISQHFSKQNSLEVLKEISSSISQNEVEYKDAHKGNIAKDVINKVKEDAKKIRYEMQIHNQEIYKVYTYIRISSKNKENIFYLADNLRTKLLTKMLNVNTLNFRHIEGYLATCPFGYNASKYLSNYYINMTTNNVKTLFPFYTNTILDKDGILFGKVKNDNKICMLDLFENSHLNSNMCIFGSSGSGKSYFTKIILLRNYLKGIKQYVIDPEGEYVSIPGTIFNVQKDIINILEIKPNEIIENYFKCKVEKVTEFICEICDLKEYIDVIRKAIVLAYTLKGITEDQRTLFKGEYDLYLNERLKSKEEFPIIEDIIEVLASNNECKKSEINKIIKKIRLIFNGNFKFLNGITNVDMNKDIIVFDISKVDISEKSTICEYILNYINEDMMHYKKSLIYIDEVWRLILKSEKLSSMVFDLYKTVRKRNSGIITITQDISDLFSKNDGMFGRSIFNNSYVKVFFKMEYQEAHVLSNIGIVNQEDYEKMTKLTKGEMFMYVQNSNLVIKVIPSEYERKIIEGGNLNDNSWT